MNQQVTTRPAPPKPPMLAGGQVAALVPQSLDEAFRVATAIAASGLAPKGVDTTEKVLVAMMAGAELGFAPFQAMQSFAIINGKPNIWGDALPALLWSRGFEIDEWFDNEDQPTRAYCKITRPGGKTIERSFSVAQAKQAGLLGKQGPWQQYQSRMLQMRARAFAARDGASDVLRGMQVAEEVQDFQPMTARAVPAERPGLAARLAAPAAGDPREGFTAVHTSPLGDDTIPDFEAGIPSDAASEQPASDGFPQPRTDAGDDFPGDAPQSSREETAEPAEADQADEGTGSAVDVVAWADKLIGELPFMTPEEIAALEKDRKALATFAILKVTNIDKARQFEAAIASAKEG